MRLEKDYFDHLNFLFLFSNHLIRFETNNKGTKNQLKQHTLLIPKL